MSLAHTLLVGFLAGTAIPLGMPLGRLARPIPVAKVVFNATSVGHRFTSEPVSVLFLNLAAGSIVYVVGQLIGLVAGFATDAVGTAAGV